MKVLIYLNNSLQVDCQTRKEFIDRMVCLDYFSDSEDYNNGQGVKTFLQACDRYMERNGNYTIKSGKDTITCKKGKLYLNGEYKFNCKA